jgi:predicted ester cyclase
MPEHMTSPTRSRWGTCIGGSFAATSDLRLTIHDTFGHEDKLCARYTVTGRHTGELMSIPPTGADLSITGITIMHFGNGKVLEQWDVDDSSKSSQD